MFISRPTDGTSEQTESEENKKTSEIALSFLAISLKIKNTSQGSFLR